MELKLKVILLEGFKVQRELNCHLSISLQLSSEPVIQWIERFTDPRGVDRIFFRGINSSPNRFHGWFDMMFVLSQYLEVIISLHLWTMFLGEPLRSFRVKDKIATENVAFKF